MRQSILYFTMLGACLLSACHDDEPTGPTDCPQVAHAPASFLAYWYFPKGSYWVYHKRGSNPVEVDTVTVIGGEVIVDTPGGNHYYGRPTCTELYFYTYRHSNRRYFGYSSPSDFQSIEHFLTQEESGQWFVTQSTDRQYSPGFIWSYPQRPVGGPIANTGPTLLDTLPVATPAGTFARSVHLQITQFHDSTRGDFLRSYHLTRGIGYTRKVYANLGTWELTSYHIAQ